MFFWIFLFFRLVLLLLWDFICLFFTCIIRRFYCRKILCIWGWWYFLLVLRNLYIFFLNFFLQFFRIYFYILRDYIGLCFIHLSLNSLVFLNFRLNYYGLSLINLRINSLVLLNFWLNLYLENWENCNDKRKNHFIQKIYNLFTFSFGF